MTHKGVSLSKSAGNMSYGRLEDENDSDETGVNNEGRYHQILEGDSAEERTEIWGYKYSLCNSILFHILAILSGGFLYLIVYWKPEWGLYIKTKKSSLISATSLLLQNLQGCKFVVDVIEMDVDEGCPKNYTFLKTNDGLASALNGVHYSTSQHSTQKRCIRFFIFQYMRYIWIPQDQSFHCLHGYDHNTLIKSLINDFRGYKVEEQISRQQLYGQNVVKVEVKSYLNLLITEVLNPFYIFQIASIVLWSFDNYYLYASCIFIVSCLSVAVSLFEIRRQSESLRDMVESSNTNEVLIRRPSKDGSFVDVVVSATDLVPGDVLVIPSVGCVMACDAVLLSGNAIVNESMLTGESVPVTKIPVSVSEENEIYSPESHKRHTLFCGTSVIQTRYYGNAQVLAVVIRTGFSTAKGELVRSILYPRPIDFKFYKDAMKFIVFMFLIASIGMGYCLYLYISRGEDVLKTIVRTLDIVTIVVPPALPAAMTVGTYYAQSRLKKLGIFCISPPRINISGKLKLVCFDKTGTLTEDGLEVWGVVRTSQINDKQSLMSPEPDVSNIPQKDHVMSCLASCHSLTYINGKIIGDPLDIKMFEATRWELEEPGDETPSFDTLIPTIVRPPKQLSKLPHSPVNAGILPSNRGQLCPSKGEWSSGQSHEGHLKASNTNGCGGGDIQHNEGDGCDNFSREEPNVNTANKVLVEPQSKGEGNEEITPTIVKPHTSHIDSPLSPNIQDSTLEMPYEIGIVRQFPFSSSAQRMSVIVRNLNQPHMELYAKGAPEVIQSLCLPETIPENFNSILTNYTIQGFRVIALARRELKNKLSWHSAQRLPREQVECDLHFLGFLVLQNMLKPETTPVINKLQYADIRTVMVTGDNILTALCVARDCNMISRADKVFLIKVLSSAPDEAPKIYFEPANNSSVDDGTEINDQNHTYVNIDSASDKYHFAVTGKVWAQLKIHFPELLPRIVARGTVFARMSPDQKAQLIEELQAIDYTVGMCGDGANDCGALKAAHVGISLSEAEASVAAPFTSHTPDITCVPAVICEGRGALTTNFSMFKYMALYSIIQFVSVLLLYRSSTNLSDPQFLYIDLFIVTVIAVFMGYTGARHELVAKRPLSNLLGPMNLFSVLSQISLVMIAQILSYVYLTQQPWFTPNPPDVGDDDEVTVTWETTTIFYVSCYQYLGLAVIYSPAKPYRKYIYTNFWLTASLVLLTIATTVMLLYPTWWIVWLMQLQTDPHSSHLIFRITLLLIAGVHYCIAWLFEYSVSESRTLKKIFHKLKCKKTPKNMFKRILREMKEDPDWPSPLS